MILSSFGRRWIALPNAKKGLSVLGAQPSLGFTPREVLSANRTYYVRTDGSNSNNGLTNSAGGAFLTIQKAIDVVRTLDLSIYNVTIQLGVAGTYADPASLPGALTGTGAVTIRGDPASPGSYLLTTSVATSGFITVSGGGKLTVSGVKLSTSGSSGVCLSATRGGFLTVGSGVEFGSTSNYHMSATYTGVLEIASNYTVSGGGTVHITAAEGGVLFGNNKTVTISGTPAFSAFFAYCNRNATIEYFGNTFVGSATGARYYAAQGGGIFVNGAGASYLPGDAAGSVGTPGWYS